MSVGDAEQDRMDQTMMGGELDIEFGSAVIMTVRGGRGVWVSPIVMGASGTIS